MQAVPLRKRKDMARALVVLFCLMLASCAGGDGEGKSETVGNGASSVTIGGEGAWLEGVLTSYYAVKQALVDADSTKADSLSAVLMASCDAAVPNAKGVDSASAADVRSMLGDLAAECEGFRGEPTLEGRRRSFSMMGQHLYPLLREAGYNAGQVYRQVCPMAFNDTETAYWLSDAREIVNPYLGRKHPKYGAGMLHCGELQDSLLTAK